MPVDHHRRSDKTQQQEIILATRRAIGERSPSGYRNKKTLHICFIWYCVRLKSRRWRITRECIGSSQRQATRTNRSITLATPTDMPRKRNALSPKPCGASIAVSICRNCCDACWAIECMKGIRWNDVCAKSGFIYTGTSRRPSEYLQGRHCTSAPIAPVRSGKNDEVQRNETAL